MVQTKGQFEAKVTFNKKLGERFYRMTLQLEGAGAEAFANTVPGQFAQFDVSNVALPPAAAIPDDLKDASTKQIILRRPFSFARVLKDKGVTTIDVVYCVLGPATVRMTTLAKGNSISVIGPLGNGFTIPQGKKLAILVAGGMGAPPLEHLAQVMTANFKGIEPIAFAGAKTKYDLPYERRLDQISQELEFWLAEFGKYVVRSLVATDDGSSGFKGTVTDCLLDWLSRNIYNPAETIIYACGPAPMLASVAKLAENKKIDCQISMEEMMACGIGLCQSCAVKCVAHAASGIPVGGRDANPGPPKDEVSPLADERTYKLCCKDGPIFDARQIVF